MLFRSLGLSKNCMNCGADLENTSNNNKTSIQPSDKAHNKIVTVENTPNDDGTFNPWQPLINKLPYQ